MLNHLPRCVLIMAGGTGGHVFPALAAAECLQEQGIQVQWLGTQRGIESRVVPAANIPIHYLSVSGLRGKSLIHTLKGLFNVGRALWQALAILRRLQPICVLGMGGFAAGPGGLAAWLLRRPLVIHEQNAVPGTTNKLLAPLAKQVLQGYPVNLGGHKGRHVGNPVRADITKMAGPEARAIGQNKRLRLLVVGGSLGAKPINEILPEVLHKLPADIRPEVRHQTGELHIEAVAEHYRSLGLNAEVLPFIEDMAAAYGWADLVLCRAGALTVAELSVVGVASILVPLPYAIDDHQTANARWLADNQAAELLPQSDMSIESLTKVLEGFMQDRDSLIRMAGNARALARPEAAAAVAEVCLEVAHD